MFPFEYLLAVALLTTPSDLPSSLGEPEAYFPIRPTLKQVALLWEIMSPREASYLLVRKEDFANDLGILRRRYQELADAPPVNDAVRFPDRATATDQLSLNRTYRQHLEARQLIDLARSWELRAALQETDQLFHIWEAVRDARCDFYDVTVRRQALKRLRLAVGFGTYYSGMLPPAVPLWRFQQID